MLRADSSTKRWRLRRRSFERHAAACRSPATRTSRGDAMAPARYLSAKVALGAEPPSKVAASYWVRSYTAISRPRRYAGRWLSWSRPGMGFSFADGEWVK